MPEEISITSDMQMIPLAEREEELKSFLRRVKEESEKAGRSPSHTHGDLTSLAPHERLPEILVVPREKTPTGAAARGNP